MVVLIKLLANLVQRQLKRPNSRICRSQNDVRPSEVLQTLRHTAVAKGLAQRLHVRDVFPVRATDSLQGARAVPVPRAMPLQTFPIARGLAKLPRSA